MNMSVPKIYVIDTSYLTVYLGINWFDKCNDKIDQSQVRQHFDQIIKEEQSIILPLATIIETASIITQSTDKHKKAIDLKTIILDSINERSPWTVFINNENQFNNENIQEIVDEWINYVDSMSLADVSIKKIADFYSTNFEVEILTCDEKLKAHESPKNTRIPRRKIK